MGCGASVPTAESEDDSPAARAKAILKREAERYYKTHVKLNRALGELDHPNPHSEHFRALTPENISHRVLDFYWDADDLVGYVEVLSTPAGAILKDLYMSGVRLGMSSRGWATLKRQESHIYIQPDFELICFDFVSDPSTEGAFLLPVQERINVAPTLPLHVLAHELNMVKPREPLPDAAGGTRMPVTSEEEATSSGAAGQLPEVEPQGTEAGCFPRWLACCRHEVTPDTHRDGGGGGGGGPAVTSTSEWRRLHDPEMKVLPPPPPVGGAQNGHL